MMVGHVRTRPLVVAAVVLLCLLIAAFAWLASRVVTAGIELRAMQSSSGELLAAIEAGDAEAATDIARAVGGQARAASTAAADPLWAVAESAPWVGDDLQAVRTLSTQAARLADGVLDPVLDLVTAVAPGSGVDPTLMAGLARTLEGAGATVSEAEAALAALDTSTLLPPIREGTETVRTALTDASPTVGALGALAAFAGAAFGQDGHTVLVALQNPAELRTGGGITGSFILVRTQDGELGIVEQADSSEFRMHPASVVPLPDSMRLLYGDVAGRFVQNTSMSTDFSQTATLASEWWRLRGGAAPDAVLSLDPLALQGLLAATGPLALADGSEVTAENLVQRLLVEPYMRLDAAEQTAFLQSVSTALFERLTATEIAPITWARVLADPISAGRLSLWSADAGVQRAIEGTVLAGPAGRLAAAGPDAFAVFLNDGTGGKMDSLLYMDMALSASQCSPDGRADITVVLTMRSSAPDGAGETLPPFMTGAGMFGIAPGDIATSVAVTAPPGTYFGGVTENGERVPSVDVEDAGRPTSLVDVVLSPGEVSVVEFRFVAAAPGALDLSLIHTPLINDPKVTVDSAGSCG